jgi:hypothetical protein
LAPASSDLEASAMTPAISDRSLSAIECHGDFILDQELINKIHFLKLFKNSFLKIILKII